MFEKLGWGGTELSSEGGSLFLDYVAVVLLEGGNL